MASQLQIDTGTRLSLLYYYGTLQISDLSIFQFPISLGFLDY